CRTSARKTQGRSGLSARISAAVPTMTMPSPTRPRFHLTASASAPPGIWLNTGDRADRQREPDVALRPPEMRQIEGDKSPEPGLHVGNEEVRPVEAAPALHRSRRAQGLAGFAIAPGDGAQPRTRTIVGAEHRRSRGRS